MRLSRSIARTFGPRSRKSNRRDAAGRFKCYKNRNLHLEMRRLDLVKELNGLAAGEYVLGNDME